MEELALLAGRNITWMWVGITVICAIIEASTLSLTTIWFAISAFLMIFVSLTPLPLIVQLLIFVVLALMLLIFTRPLILTKLEKNKVSTNYDRNIGQTAMVTKRITPTDKGTVKLNGMEWTAGVKDDTVLEEGSKCIVTEISGVTAWVKAL